MKYIIESLWNFLQQIPQKVTGLIHHKLEVVDSNTPTHKCHSRVLGNRRGRKRKSFHSFLRDESQSKRRTPQTNCWKKGSAKMPRFSKKTKKERFLMSFEGDSFRDEHSKDNFTNEVHPPAMQIQPQCSEIFEDNNGLQISAISSQRRANEQQSRVYESDEELLQLICGGQASAAADMGGSVSRNFSRRKDGKEWWQRAVEGESSRQVRSGLEKQGRGDNVKQRIKVITLIDLTIDQDNPMEYHIPLALI